MPPPPVPAPPSRRSEKEKNQPSVDNVQDPELSDPPASKKGKGKQRAVILSDDEDDGANAADISTNNIVTDIDSPAPAVQKNTRKPSGGGQGSRLKVSLPLGHHPLTGHRSHGMVRRRRTMYLRAPLPVRCQSLRQPVRTSLSCR